MPKLDHNDKYNTYRKHLSNQELANESNCNNELVPNGYIAIPLSGPYVIDGMRGLVASEFCDITMTLHYLFISNDFEVLDCLEKKLREFNVNIVAYHLLQLMQLYIKTDITSHFIYKYISYVTESDVRISLLCSWMLDALIKDNAIINKLVKERIKLLDEEITINNVYNSKSHNNESDALATVSVQSNNKSIYVESKVFYSKLVKIGSFLLSTKRADRSAVLQMCIFKMNTLLTDGIFIPFINYPPHRILQISPYFATVLNSKERVPFMICIEVLESLEDVEQDLKQILEFHKDSKRISEFENYFKSKYIDYNFLDDNYKSEHDSDSITTNNQCDIPAMEDFDIELSNQPASAPDSPISNTKFVSHSKANSVSYVISAQEIRNKLFVLNSNVPSKGRSYPSKSKNFHLVNNGSYFHDASDDSSRSINSSVLSFSKVQQAFESWDQRVDHIRKMSPFSHLKGWNVYSVIVKCGDDLRQDLLAYQLLRKCQEVWEYEKTGLWIKPYEVAIISNDCGLIEVINDAISLHQLKKTTKKTLTQYFETIYGSKNEDAYLQAQKNFIKSLAAYSIFQYVFRIKDRHNSNIMLDNDGHIIHIDFGYMLAITPKNLAFETSPFKMTNEYVELMNGIDSDLFLYFRALMFHGLFALQKHMDKFIHIVQIMLDSNIPCVGSSSSVINSLKSRFHANIPDEAFSQLVDSLINKSIRSITTRLYDRYQYFANGIL